MNFNNIILIKKKGQCNNIRILVSIYTLIKGVNVIIY